MKVKVIEIIVQGQKCYLVDPSIFGNPSTTTDFLKATNYDGQDEALKQDLDVLRVEGDGWYARSGLPVDALPEVVEIEIQAIELSRTQGRQMHEKLALG
jgi:hypothetical protein